MPTPIRNTECTNFFGKLIWVWYDSNASTPSYTTHLPLPTIDSFSGYPNPPLDIQQTVLQLNPNPGQNYPLYRTFAILHTSSSRTPKEITTSQSNSVLNNPEVYPQQRRCYEYMIRLDRHPPISLNALLVGYHHYIRDCRFHCLDPFGAGSSRFGFYVGSGYIHLMLTVTHCWAP